MHQANCLQNTHKTCDYIPKSGRQYVVLRCGITCLVKYHQNVLLHATVAFQLWWNDPYIYIYMASLANLPSPRTVVHLLPANDSSTKFIPLDRCQPQQFLRNIFCSAIRHAFPCSFLLSVLPFVIALSCVYIHSSAHLQVGFIDGMIYSVCLRGYMSVLSFG